jgi:O-antigen/teichoic acid export membrane protein
LTAAPAPDAREPVLAVTVTPGLLVRRLLHSLVLQALLKARGFLVVPVYARLLDPAGLGVVTLAAALATLLAPVLVLGLHLGTGLQIVHLRDREALSRAYFTSVRIAAVAAIAGSVVAALVLPRTGPSLAPLRPFAAALALLLATTALRELALLIPQLLQESAVYNGFSLAMDYGAALGGVLLVSLGFGPAGILWATGGLVAGGIVAALARTLRVLGRPAGFDRAFLSSALAVGVPGLPIALGQWMLQAADTFFLAHYHGVAVVGVYGVAYTLASVVLLVLGALNFVLLPSAASLWAEDPEHLAPFIDRTLRLTTLVLGLFVAGACLLSAWAVPWLAGPTYAAAATVLPLVVASWSAHTLMQVVQKVPMVVGRHTSSVSWCSVGTAALNVALNLALIPRGGMRGAAVATLVSYLAGLVAMGEVARRWLPELRWWRSVGPACLLVLALSLAAVALAVPASAGPVRPFLAATLLIALFPLAARAAGVLTAGDWRVVKDAIAGLGRGAQPSSFPPSAPLV